MSNLKKLYHSHTLLKYNLILKPHNSKPIKLKSIPLMVNNLITNNYNLLQTNSLYLILNL
jgi:hypothetical protein